MPERKREKRIVPKSSYLALLAQRVALGLGSLGLVILTALCFLLAFCCLIATLFTLAAQSAWCLLWIGLGALSVGGIRYLKKSAEKQMEEAGKELDVVPLTKANVSLVPPDEILVRDAALPQGDQQKILLRAAAPSQPTTSSQDLLVPVEEEQAQFARREIAACESNEILVSLEGKQAR